MPGFIRTSRDEHLWQRAKARAAAEGKTEQWPYITGIFKHMKGGSVDKTAARHNIVSNIIGLISGKRLGGLQNRLIRRGAKFNQLHEAMQAAEGKGLHKARILQVARQQGKSPKLQERLEQKILGSLKKKEELRGSALNAENKESKAKAVLDKFQRKATLVGNVGAGALAAGGVAGGVALYRRKKRRIAAELANVPIVGSQIKTAAEKHEDTKVNWKKLLGFAALSGAAMGATKGLGENYILKKVTESLAKHPNTKLPLRAHLPWIAARGVTGGAGAAVGATSMALGLKTSKKKEEKK